MWQIGAAANLIVALAYLLIARAILVPLIRTKQLKSNVLGGATAAIFITCAIHHGGHSFHMLMPAFGLDSHSTHSMRAVFSSWYVVSWDVITATMGVYYWSLRRTYGSLMQGAALFLDLKEQQRRALEIYDNIVQGLVVAETALDLDQKELSKEALAATLVSARQIISDLIGAADSENRLGAGDLRREKAASVKKR